MRRLALVGPAALVLSAMALTAQPSAAVPIRFDRPVLLTTDPAFGGFEPGVIVDRFNNVYVTAHKSSYARPVSPDARGTVPARAQSWLWTSHDGRTFTDLPGLTPIREQSFEVGDEGDLARDDTGHVYFVDYSVVDVTFSRYKATGPGAIALEATRPVLPSAEPVDDRPWITAHGDGVVLYVGNQGSKLESPAGTVRGGQAAGPGRFTAYMSYDHGDTFDPIGYSLADSGWCRPAADHRKGSHDLYVICTNDADEVAVAGPVTTASDKGTLWAFASHDDGRTWTRTRMGSYRWTPLWTYPAVAVDSRGTIYALFNDITGNPTPRESHLYLYTSTTRGRTWTAREVTPREGIIDYTWLDVAPNGTLGIGYYYRADRTQPWYVYAGTARPGRPFAVSRVSASPIASRSSDTPVGDFFQVAFGPDNRLHVVWTAEAPEVAGLNSNVFYARQH